MPETVGDAEEPGQAVDRCRDDKNWAHSTGFWSSLAVGFIAWGPILFIVTGLLAIYFRHAADQHT